MDKKQSRWEKIFKFVGDKGFYIVLFLCVAIIGVCAWMISGSMGGLDEADSKSVIAKSSPAVPTINAAAAADIAPPATEETLNQPSDNAPTINDGEGAVSVSVPDTDDSQKVSSDSSSDTVSSDSSDSIPTQFIWPVSGNIETPYSVDALIYDRTMADWRTHSGIDIEANMGAAVMSAASGTVERVYADSMYGTTVIIHHGGGLRSIYSNLAETPTVAVGDNVEAGQIIGSIGETALAEIGDVTHLHFAMTLDGQSVNPQDYLPEK